jgi:uncharacterized protein (DUF1697 family)
MSTVPAKLNTYVALLRGINVTGNNIVPMKVLAEIFTSLGCTDVKTYIASGNVVFRAPAAKAKTLGPKVTAEIGNRCGCEPAVMFRSAEQIAEVVRANPFRKSGTDEKAFHVCFLDGVPDPEKFKALELKQFLPDECELVDDVLYLYLPNGVAESKLARMDLRRKLGVTNTVRNWRTVGKLAGMANRM